MNKGKKQNFNSLIYFIISIFIINFRIFDCMIIIPIKTLREDNYIFKSDNPHKNIMKNYFFKELYTILEIGTPFQKIFLFISTKNQDYQVISKTAFKDKNINNLINYKYNLSNIYYLYNLFNEQNSKTYKLDNCKDILGLSDDYETICKSNDSFLFYQDINMTKIIKYDNFIFKLIIETDNNIPGEIGLGIFDKYRDEDNNFLKVLKNLNLIDNYNWYFDINSWENSNGKLVIGSLPHENYPHKYSEDNLIYTNIYIDSYSFRGWRLEFDNIYINDIYLSMKKVEFSFDSDIIIGTNELEKKLNKQFFNNLILYKNCFNDTFNIYSYLWYKFFYCNINLKRTLFDLLPSIKFFSNDLKYTFEITKDEIFEIKDNYIYLKIIFPISQNQNYFILGRIFTLKYPFVFNPDLNKIGFYRKINEINKINNNKDNNYNYIKISIIIILFIILLFCILKFINYIKFNRKKRAKEISDGYKYNNNLIENNYKSNIEMKIKI